ncbi:MAG TPA: GNAT family N-acetyltransferase [Gaiellaceae bacterium]|jgi:predicted acetyltransferase|nr:GNAT family N-acetyltransferase [Gaiellaceae bacterium]
MLEVRPCRPEEFRAGLSPIFHYFGRAPTEEAGENIGRLLPADRLHAAWDDGVVVGGAGAFPFELTVPGGRVRAAGVTLVGVLPTHRRRGVLRSMMRAQLDAVHERGEPVAVLWASEDQIYTRFGYGLASLQGEIDVSRAYSTFHEPLERRGRVRLLDKAEAAEALPPIHERVAAETSGMFARSADWWESRLLSDPDWLRRGRGEMQRALLELDGEPVGYALYRLNLSFEYGSSTGELDVVEALGTGPQAVAELWRFLLDVDWMDRIKAPLLPIDHPLRLLLAEPRRLRFTLVDGIMVRLVDVGAALAARAYAGDGTVVAEVRDAFCPWNEGRWRLGPGAERTDAEPELRMDVSALGSVYLGGFTFAELGRAGRLEELASGAVARADELFRVDRAPWCPEIF